MKTNGELWSFGYNSYGKLGDNSEVHKSSPVQIPGNWTSIVGGIKHVYATKKLLTD